MALPSHKNRVGMTVTGTPGTGTITLNAAETGYQSFATAYGANANVDVLIEEGSAWEIARDCTYTHSGTTLSRGTLEASSTGSALSLTSAAKVYVVNSATRIQKMIGGYLENSTHDGTAAVTGVVGTMHVFTGLTADRDFTLPSTAAAGDRIGVSFPAGSADYEILLKSASGDKINNVDCSSTEWSRLFIAGETVIFRCVDGSTVDWVVEYDGRIPASTTITLTTNADGESAATATAPTSAGGAWTAAAGNLGNKENTSNGQVTVRRAGLYQITAGGRSKDTQVDVKYWVISIYKNNSDVKNNTSFNSKTSQSYTIVTGLFGLAVDDYVDLRYTSETGSVGLSAVPLSSFHVSEVL